MDICIIDVGYLHLNMRLLFINKSLLNALLQQALKTIFDLGKRLMNIRHDVTTDQGNGHTVGKKLKIGNKYLHFEFRHV